MAQTFFRSLFVVVASSDDGEMRHLEGITRFAAPLESSGHAVAHVEIGRADVRSQVELKGKENRLGSQEPGVRH